METGLNSAWSNSVSTGQWFEGTTCDYRQGVRQTAHDQNPYHIFQTLSIDRDNFAWSHSDVPIFRFAQMLHP